MLSRLVLLALSFFCVLPGTAALAGPNDVAIIIGNRDYQGIVPQVEYAVRDAQAFAKAAREVLGVRTENIKDLSNLGVLGFRRWFGEAGEGSAQLSALVKAKDARIYVFYSGHGMPAERPDGSVVRVVLPIDALPENAGREGYPITWLRDAVHKVQIERAPDGDVVLMLDACFSGTSAAGTLATGSSAVTMSASRLRETQVGRVIELAAASADQIAYWDRERQHGTFTDALIDGLYGEAADANGRVTAERLALFVQERVGQRLGRLFPRETPSQTPMLVGDARVVLASLDAKRPAIRDIDRFATEQALCAALPKATDVSRIASFLDSCRYCMCRSGLEARLAELQRLDAMCRSERALLDKLKAEGNKSREEAMALLASAQCPELKNEAANLPAHRPPATAERPPELTQMPRVLAARQDPGASPVQAAPPAATDTETRTQLVRAVQTELKRIGCDPGNIDGQWGERAKEALRQYARAAKVALASDEPDAELLRTLVERSGRVCAVKCAQGLTLINGACAARPVAPARSSGMSCSAWSRCVSVSKEGFSSICGPRPAGC